jgi:hypothetical protein
VICDNNLQYSRCLFFFSCVTREHIQRQSIQVFWGVIPCRHVSTVVSGDPSKFIFTVKKSKKQPTYLGRLDSEYKGTGFLRNVNIYIPKRRNAPEDLILQQNRCKFFSRVLSPSDCLITIILAFLDGRCGPEFVYTL